MDANKFKGSWHHFKGDLKKKWGAMTDDDLLECEGNYEKFLGVVQKRYGDKKGNCSNGPMIGIPSASRKRSVGGRQLPRVIKRDFLMDFPAYSGQIHLISLETRFAGPRQCRGEDLQILSFLDVANEKIFVFL